MPAAGGGEAEQGQAELGPRGGRTFGSGPELAAHGTPPAGAGDQAPPPVCLRPPVLSEPQFPQVCMLGSGPVEPPRSGQGAPATPLRASRVTGALVPSSGPLVPGGAKCLSRGQMRENTASPAARGPGPVVPPGVGTATETSSPKCLCGDRGGPRSSPPHLPETRQTAGMSPAAPRGRPVVRAGGWVRTRRRPRPPAHCPEEGAGSTVEAPVAPGCRRTGPAGGRRGGSGRQAEPREASRKPHWLV